MKPWRREKDPRRSCVRRPLGQVGLGGSGRGLLGLGGAQRDSDPQAPKTDLRPLEADRLRKSASLLVRAARPSKRPCAPN